MQSLNKVCLSDSLEKIGDEAFKNCKQLKTIQILSKNLKSVGADAFQGINKDAVIYCPKECVNTYKKMFYKAGVNKKVMIKGM